MATYREIHGKAVKSVSTDPSATTDAGQIWYNTASDTYKTILNIEAWVSNAPTINSLYRRSSAGPTTAAFLAGGDSGPGPSVSNLTEEWDGSGFSAGGNINTGRYSAGGAGTLTAGLAFGGGTNPTPPNYQTATESYNGTAWTNSPNGLNTARFVTQGVGTTTAALCMGGLKSPSNTAANNSEEWGGTSWTAGNTLNTARESAAQAGIQTAALLAGGYSTTYSADTESYDGTTWTSVNSMNTARFSLGGAGTQTSAVAYGGDKNPSTVVGATEIWDGTNWTTSPATMATARMHPGDFGISTNAFAAAGGTPTVTNVTEEFNSSANVVTPTAWAAGENLGTGRYGAGIGQSQTACGLAGLQKASPTSAIGNTELYDGTSWSPSGSLAVSRYRMSGCGTQTAGLGMGGYGGPGGPGYKSNVEEFSGSSWTSQTALPGGCQFGSANGPQTAAIYCMYNTPGGDSAEGLDYNGTSWTAGDNMVTTRRQGCLIGAAATQTAAIAAGGNDTAPTPNVKTTESYNGSSWTTVNSMNTGRHAAGSSGIQGNADIFGSDPTTGYPQVTTENYNGTTWTTRANAATARVAVHNGGGGTGAAIFMGGNPGSNSTEEFTDASTALNVKTLTQS